LQVSKSVPPKFPPAERKAAKTARKLAARQQQQQQRQHEAAAHNAEKKVTFEVSIGTTIENTSPEPSEADNGSSSDGPSAEEHVEVDARVKGEMSTLSARFDHLNEEAPTEEGEEADQSEDNDSAAEGEGAEECEDNGLAAEGEDSGDDGGDTSERSGSDPGEIELDEAHRAENNILRERIRGMIEAEDSEFEGGVCVFDADNDEDCYDNSYLGMIEKLKEVISTFPVDGDLRVLRDWYLQLGDLQNDDLGYDDLDAATDAFAHAKRLSLLIAKGKTIATSTAANTIDKSAQSVHLVEGASSDTGIPDDRGHSEWSPNDDEQLAAGKVRFPSGRAHRWRDIAKLVGKKEEACRSRARCDAFIKVHLHPATRGRMRRTSLKERSERPRPN
jgi:hypothetical protein